jgi:SWI/SNF-related matrix-associated actin-dependent regulator 1 of chromatin subfamily A
MLEPLYYPDGKSLLPFQEECIRKMLYFLRTNGGVYNACEQGLGKSIQTIVTCNGLARDYTKPIIIVCPAVMRLVWKQEFKDWSIETNVRVVKKRDELDNLESANVYIVSYELAASDDFQYWLRRKEIDVLILDEAHYLKSTKAQRTKKILGKVWPKAKYKIALSGTPFTQNVIDGYTLFHRFNPLAFPDFRTFASTYANRKFNGFGIQWEGLKNADKLRDIVINSFFIRRNKAQVLPDLPAKMFKQITLDKSFAVKRTLEQSLAEDKYYKDLEEILKTGDFARVPPPIAIATLRREQGLKKVEPIVEYIKNLLEQDVPLVVFCCFRELISQLEHEFSKYKPAVIHGDVSATRRKEAIDNFQEGKTNLFIGQMTAAGVGITLTRSSNVILAEYSYSPAEIVQAVDRCHRIGQKSAVTVHYFTVEDSVDEKIIKIVVKKAAEFGEILDDRKRT